MGRKVGRERRVEGQKEGAGQGMEEGRGKKEKR